MSTPKESVQGKNQTVFELATKYGPKFIAQTNLDDKDFEKELKELMDACGIDNNKCNEFLKLVGPYMDDQYFYNLTQKLIQLKYPQELSTDGKVNEGAPILRTSELARAFYLYDKNDTYFKDQIEQLLNFDPKFVDDIGNSVPTNLIQHLLDYYQDTPISEKNLNSVLFFNTATTKMAQAVRERTEGDKLAFLMIITEALKSENKNIARLTISQKVEDLYQRRLKTAQELGYDEKQIQELNSIVESARKLAKMLDEKLPEIRKKNEEEIVKKYKEQQKQESQAMEKNDGKETVKTDEKATLSLFNNNLNKQQTIAQHLEEVKNKLGDGRKGDVTKPVVDQIQSSGDFLSSVERFESVEEKLAALERIFKIINNRDPKIEPLYKYTGKMTQQERGTRFVTDIQQKHIDLLRDAYRTIQQQAIQENPTIQSELEAKARQSELLNFAYKAETKKPGLWSTFISSLTGSKTEKLTQKDSQSITPPKESKGFWAAFKDGAKAALQSFTSSLPKLSGKSSSSTPVQTVQTNVTSTGNDNINVKPSVWSRFVDTMKSIVASVSKIGTKPEMEIVKPEESAEVKQSRKTLMDLKSKISFATEALHSLDQQYKDNKNNDFYKTKRDLYVSSFEFNRKELLSVIANLKKENKDENRSLINEGMQFLEQSNLHVQLLHLEQVKLVTDAKRSLFVGNKTEYNSVTMNEDIFQKIMQSLENDHQNLLKWNNSVYTGDNAKQFKSNMNQFLVNMAALKEHVNSFTSSPAFDEIKQSYNTRFTELAKSCNEQMANLESIKKSTSKFERFQNEAKGKWSEIDGKLSISRSLDSLSQLTKKDSQQSHSKSEELKPIKAGVNSSNPTINPTMDTPTTDSPRTSMDSPRRI